MDHNHRFSNLHTQSTPWDVQLFSGTEGFMIVIQNIVMKTRTYKKYIEKIPLVNDECRMCNAPGETIHHKTSYCSTMAHTEYTNRHHLTAAIMHQVLLKHHNHITTDNLVGSNIPDITYIQEQNRTAYVIDIAQQNQ